MSKKNWDRELALKVKRANERLRALEKVNKLATQSYIYRTVQSTALNAPHGSGKIYNITSSSKSVSGFHISLRGKSFFESLNSREQEHYLEYLDKILEAPSSTKSGIEAIKNKSFETFQKSTTHPVFATREEYDQFWEAYQEVLNRNSEIGENYIYNAMITTLRDLNQDEDEIVTYERMFEKINEYSQKYYIDAQNFNPVSEFMKSIRRK